MHDELKSIKLFKNRSPYVELPTQFSGKLYFTRVGFCLIKRDNEQWIKAFQLNTFTWAVCEYVCVRVSIRSRLFSLWNASIKPLRKN